LQISSTMNSWKENGQAEDLTKTGSTNEVRI
jgi:hypothetical protein